MRCPHCRSSVTTQRSDRTELGYRRFRCRACQREFNERTGGSVSFRANGVKTVFPSIYNPVE